MSQAEYDAMVKTGTVQESTSGTTHVVLPANPKAFEKQAKPGSVYVEFDVPVASVKQTQAGWGKIVGPNSLEGRLAARLGRPIPKMPAAYEIEMIIMKSSR